MTLSIIQPLGEFQVVFLWKTINLAPIGNKNRKREIQEWSEEIETNEQKDSRRLYYTPS